MSDAVQAFEQLRAEVTVMRRTVEELRAAIETVPAVDYAPTLGQIAAAQAEIAEDVDAIAEATGSLSYADRVMSELVEARETALRPAIMQLGMAQHSALCAAQAVRDGVDYLRDLHEQRRALKWAFGAGIAVGLLLFPLMVGPAIDKVTGFWTDDPAPAGQPAKAR